MEKVKFSFIGKNGEFKFKQKKKHRIRVEKTLMDRFCLVFFARQNFSNLCVFRFFDKYLTLEFSINNRGWYHIENSHFLRHRHE